MLGKLWSPQCIIAPETCNTGRVVRKKKHKARNRGLSFSISSSTSEDMQGGTFHLPRECPQRVSSHYVQPCKAVRGFSWLQSSCFPGDSYKEKNSVPVEGKTLFIADKGEFVNSALNLQAIL